MWKLCLVCGVTFLFVFGIVEMFMPVNLPDPVKRIENPKGMGEILHNFDAGSGGSGPTTLAYTYTQEDEEFNPEHKAGVHPSYGTAISPNETKGLYGFLAGIYGMILFTRWMWMIRNGGYGIYGTLIIGLWALGMFMVVFFWTLWTGGNVVMCKQMIYAYRFDLPDLLSKVGIWLLCGISLLLVIAAKLKARSK